MQITERISAKLSKFTPSLTLKLKDIAEVRKSLSLPVYDFGLGETRGPLDPTILKAGMQAFSDEDTMYARPQGLPELRQKVLEWIPNCVDHYTEDNVVISNGAKQALFNVFLSVCNPGDSVLFDSAPWVSYTPMATMAYATPHQVLPMTKKDNFLKITPDDLIRNLKMRPHAKLFLLNNPVNPTSQIYNEQEVNELLDVCASRQTYFMLDRLYWKIVFDGAEYPEPKITPKTKPWLIQIDGMSKNFSRAGGLRVGWAIVPDDLAKAMVNLQSHYTSGPPTPLQRAALAAISKPYRGRLCSQLQGIRDILYEESRDIPNIKVWPTPAAFYSFWDIRGLYGKQGITSSDDVAGLLAKDGVITAPGSGFMQDGYLRLSFATTEDQVRGGMKVAKQIISNLS